MEHRGEADGESLGICPACGGETCRPGIGRFGILTCRALACIELCRTYYMPYGKGTKAVRQ
jgi:hypothetical protein